MSASLKLALVPDDATRDLWRVAETDDVDELARILPRVGNVNARNEHGMTALMRAAHHGQPQVVRALLEHGADPNLTRNDKFTALALAAFFGHTETVRILIEHGAKTEVVTRCGASARTWATARTFAEVARCLDARRDPRPTPPVAPAAAVKTVVTPAAPVKTLKEPPEIWDLVHEVPKGFDPRSAFVARIKSMKGSFALRLAAVLVIGGACVVGVLVMRGSQARSLPPEIPQQRNALEKQVSAPTSTAAVVVDSVPVPAPEPVVENVKRSSSSRKLHFAAASSSEPIPTASVETVERRETPVAAPVIAPPQAAPRTSLHKPNNALSPQLIAPEKSSPPKAKVIQWP
jgi:Ankyrin repeats (3 copies)